MRMNLANPSDLKGAVLKGKRTRLVTAKHLDYLAKGLPVGRLEHSRIKECMTGKDGAGTGVLCASGACGRDSLMRGRRDNLTNMNVGLARVRMSVARVEVIIPGPEAGRMRTL